MSGKSENGMEDFGANQQVGCPNSRVSHASRDARLHASVD